jgi:hypothetical protein
MRFSKPKWIHASGLLAALVMVLAGLVLCRLGTPVASSTTPEAGAWATAQVQASEPADEEAAVESAAPATEPSGLTEEPGPAQQSTTEVQAPAPAPRKPTPPAPKAEAVTRKPVPQSYLPPFQPGAYGTQTTGMSGPPPDVLWLSGVIQGEPKVAVLRRGEKRYYVRQGDTIDDGYTVVRISSNEVTLKRGRRTRALRLGQY